MIKPSAQPADKTPSFSARELVCSRDFLLSLSATALILLPLVIVHVLSWSGVLLWKGEDSALSGFADFVLQNSLVVSGAVLGVTIAAFALLTSAVRSELFGKMYGLDSDRFSKYLGVILFPLKLAAVVLAGDFLMAGFKALFSSQPAALLTIGAVAIFLTLWEVTSLLAAGIQIRDAVITGARTEWERLLKAHNEEISNAVSDRDD